MRRKINQLDHENEKYCFLFDARTDEKWWVNFSDHHLQPPQYMSLPRSKQPISTPLTQCGKYFQSYSFSELIYIINHFDLYLRLFNKYKFFAQNSPSAALFTHQIYTQLVQYRAVLYNEILVGISLNSLVGFFYTDKNVMSNAIQLKEEVQRKYSLDIPIFQYITFLGEIKLIGA